MDINAGLVDQRVGRIVEQHAEALSRGDAKVANDAAQMKSRAFVALCVQVLLDIALEDALDLLTDGGHDLGIDAMFVDGVCDGEFVITLFQGKYKKRLDGNAAFGANEVLKLVRTVGMLFDPNKHLEARGDVLLRVEEARGMVREGYIPRVRVILCNNGQRWKADGQAHIDAAGYPEEQVSFEHFNHEGVVDLLRAPKKVSDTLRLSGKALVEEFDFRRVLVGKIAVSELKALFDRHGERLLERNIRRYLGMGSGRRVNKAIAETLRDPAGRSDFYFFNNGITLTCQQFRHNALQGDDHLVRIEDLQVINGGQTCVTIQRTLKRLKDEDFDRTYVLLRLYELGPDDDEVVQAITYATNSQNPVDLSDLRSNDPIQQRLEMGLAELGITYLRKRGTPRGKDNITPNEAAEAVLAVWRRKPHLARSQRKQLFGTLYDTIFTDDLSASDVAIAVALVRGGETVSSTAKKAKKADSTINDNAWLRYASHHIAMLWGDAWRHYHPGSSTDEANLRRFYDFLSMSSESESSTVASIACKIWLLLLAVGLDPDKDSLQRVSAAFRRGALLDPLPDLAEAMHERAAADPEVAWFYNRAFPDAPVT